MNTQIVATSIVKKLVESGHTAYFAGGWVRDYLMGHPSADIDIATDAAPEKIIEIFPHTVPVGIDFGVVVVVEEGHPFEVTTFRKDIEYLDGRKPQRIEMSSPEEDALRRDFTINGMFYDPLTDRVFDYVNGKEDLEKGIVRAIGNPEERFIEDRLRMIRGIRIAARYHFEIDPDTEAAIRKHAHTLFPPVAIERVWMEFKKMAEAPNFGKCILQLYAFGLLEEIFPSLEEREILLAVSGYENYPEKTPTIVYIMELFKGRPFQEQMDVCDYLKISNKETQMAAFLHQARENCSGQPDDYTWALFYADPRSDLCLRVIDHENLHAHEKRLKRLEPHIERIRKKHPLISSEYLRREGIQPGKKMGVLLKESEKIAVNSDLRTPEAVLEKLKLSEKWSQ